MSKVVVIGGGVIGCAAVEARFLFGAPGDNSAVGFRHHVPAGHRSHIVEVMGARNLVIATGHHRDGILMAPLAAMQVASIIGAG